MLFGIKELEEVSSTFRKGVGEMTGHINIKGVITIEYCCSVPIEVAIAEVEQIREIQEGFFSEDLHIVEDSPPVSTSELEELIA